LSHSANPFLWFFFPPRDRVSNDLPRAGFKLPSSWSLPPEKLVLLTLKKERQILSWGPCESPVWRGRDPEV
jgi:hypothetical protein